jgi:hypothetical protein
MQPGLCRFGHAGMLPSVLMFVGDVLATISHTLDLLR